MHIIINSKLNCGHFFSQVKSNTIIEREAFRVNGLQVVRLIKISGFYILSDSEIVEE